MITNALPLSRAEASRVAASEPGYGIRHRADIDGLRAVAVLPVLLYHAGFPLVGGGFVGVDVFFVISGYLITAILLVELDAGRFSLVRFYERRVRRLLPAIFAVLLASVAIGWLVLLPEDLKDLGQSAVATVAFASNLLFWHDIGYFDLDAERKVLLHTWSLAVEEQFYLVFPLLLWLLLKLGRPVVPHLLTGLLLLSFAAAAVAVQTAPGAAFYLAPLRAWELLLGAVLAAGVVSAPQRPWLRDLCSVAGLVLILGSVHLISAEMPFPGVAALAPCLGTALVILGGMSGPSLAGRALSAGPVVFVGLISYSLYLWHWPLLVLAKSYLARELTLPEAGAVLVLAGILSAASWRWIEQPFRAPSNLLSRPALFTAAGAGSAAVVAVGLVLHVQEGVPWRLPEDAQRLAAGVRDRSADRNHCFDRTADQARAGDLCPEGPIGEIPPSFVIWGDSHAEMLRDAFDVAAREAGRSGLFAGLPGCPPLAQARIAFQRGTFQPGADRCTAYNAAVLELLERERAIDTVVLAGHWPVYATGTPYRPRTPGRLALEDLTPEAAPAAPKAVFHRRLLATVERLRAVGKRVVIVGSVPETRADVPWTLALSAWHGRGIDLRPTRADFEARNEVPLAAFDELERGGLASIIRPETLLCDAERCMVEAQGRALYADDNHLTLFGAAVVTPLLVAGLGGTAAVGDDGAVGAGSRLPGP